MTFARNVSAIVRESANNKKPDRSQAFCLFRLLLCHSNPRHICCEDMPLFAEGENRKK